MKEKNELVSIIVPVYNVEKYIMDAIDSVRQQTYTNWELLLIDDCSTDDSIKIIEENILGDIRIKLLKQERNCGVALARNRGIDEAQGRYICFLDSDDLWKKEKLEKQVNFMKEKDCAFSYTSYEFVNEFGESKGKQAIVPNKINYKQALKNTTIFTSTVMLDINKLTKEQIYMPNLRKGQDTATWWKILKIIDFAYGDQEVLSLYRRRNDTLSSNKFKALKRTWGLYRNVEHLGVFYSIYNFMFYFFNAIKRRI